MSLPIVLGIIPVLLVSVSESPCISYILKSFSVVFSEFQVRF